MAAGKHVLIEKPIADTEKEAARLIAYAQEKGVVCLEAIHYKWVIPFSSYYQLV